MDKFNRLLNLDLPNKQSSFLWGARKTGKSTFLKNNFPNAIFYDFLKSDVYLKYAKEPYRLRQELEAKRNINNKMVILDEVQRVPSILNEVHYLIENTDYQFILCGSSARKLKRHDVNLLGGRAWKFNLFPLTSSEIPDFDVIRAFNHGLIPTHYLSKMPNRFLKSYIEDYLVHEIQAEGFVRSLPNFARFLDVLGFCQGELINYSNIARECHIDSKTVREYFQIIVDTSLGYYLYPYFKKESRDILYETPKFYMFDIGVTNYIKRINIKELKGSDAGKSLEQLIFLELLSYKSYTEKNYDMYFWRTKSGLEVDFIIDRASVAIEVKISSSIQKDDLKGLIAFQREHNPKKSVLVCIEDVHRHIKTEVGVIEIIPFDQFLKHLWNGEIV